MKIKYLATIMVVALSFVSGLTLPVASSNLNKSALHHTDSRVYICGGKYATKFHSHSKCRGLNNCKGGIYTYDSIKDAEKAGYSYCRICWK